MYRKRIRPSFVSIPSLLVLLFPLSASAQSNGAGSSIVSSVQGWASKLGLAFLFQKNNVLDGAILFGAIIAGVIAGRLAAWGLSRAGNKRKDAGHEIQASMFHSTSGPLNLFLMTLGIWLGTRHIVMRPDLSAFTLDVISLLFYVSVFWWIFRAVATVEMGLRAIVSQTSTKLDKMLLPLIRKALRIFVVIVGFLLIADNVFGQDIGAWLAGIGIAGIAVSLAAQDSLKNLFGSVTILLDRPFRVGDRINFGGFDGPVEEIGFRSTKIRTLTGHLVTVPNSKVVSEAVENIAARPYIRRLFNITITYDTKPPDIELAVNTVKRILDADDIRGPINGRIGNDEFPPRVYFNDLNQDSLNIIVIYWFFPPAYWDFLEHAQKVNLRLMEEFGRLGIDFAFPTQTIHLQDGTDPARAGRARVVGSSQPPV